MSIVFCVDSVIDADEAYFASNDVKMIGHGLVIDGEEIFDGYGKIYSSKNLYKLLREGKEITTLQGNIDQMYDIFKTTLSEGNDLIFLSFSSALSGTFQTASMVANEIAPLFPDREIRVVDSKCAAAGQRILLEKGLLKRDEGLLVDELVSFFEDEHKFIHHYAVIDDLEHLKRGGRISKTSAMVGGLVGIKPIIHITPEGTLVPFTRARGMQNAYSILTSKINDNIVYGEDVYVSHADNIEGANILKKMILENTHANNVHINFLGNTIGCHVGPNAVGVFFKGVKR